MSELSSCARYVAPPRAPLEGWREVIDVKEGMMRKHLPIALAGAALLVGATGTVAQAAPGAKGPKGGDVRNLPGFVKKWQGEKQPAADLVARGRRAERQGRRRSSTTASTSSTRSRRRSR